MATPERVELVDPLSGKSFRARTMGSSYYISGVDTDLRELGSIEEVRRFSLVTSPFTGYTDYTWEFLAPDEFGAGVVDALNEALQARFPEGTAPHRQTGDFERLELARCCFVARGLDRSAQAELALLGYYVALDLGRRDLIPTLRDDASELFAQALEEDELPAPLRLRYAYLAGELARRAGRYEDAERDLRAAIEAREAWEDEEAPGAALDLGELARRMLAAVVYREASAEVLLELVGSEDAPVAREASRLLASRRDRASLEAALLAWKDSSSRQRTDMLRELVLDPAPLHYELFVSALESPAPEAIRLAARGLGSLNDPRALEPLLECLRRGVLSTEGALVEALRRLQAPGAFEAVADLLEAWDENSQQAEEDLWFFSSDTTPLRNLLYRSGEPFGLELLIHDLRALGENDLWDKVPSGGPVSAALTLEAKSAQVDLPLALRGLLGDPNPAARRWAAYCLASRKVTSARDELKPLLQDPDSVVRLQAASALAKLGDPSHEVVVLAGLESLEPGDLPFALHFLVPFQSEAVTSYLLSLLEREAATPSELLPLLGRQVNSELVEPILLQALLDTNDETRAGAVTGLAFQGGESAAERLTLIFDSEESEEVQRRVVFGLGQLAQAGVRREESVAFLRERLGRANPRLRYALALTLLQLGDPTGIDLVRERAALFDESCDRYDLVAPALKALAKHAAALAAGSSGSE